MSDMPSGAPRTRDGRLETWKEIAAYLKRDVRTVQRWEKTESLPVHRHQHARGSTVYAIPHELNAWWEGRRPGFEQPGEPGRRKWAVPVAAGCCLAALAALILVWRPFQIAPEPELRRLWTGPDVDHFGAVSRDGRYLSYASKESADLMLRDLASGRERRLTHKPAKAQVGGAGAMSFSPDGRSIAFVWDEGTLTSLRTIQVNGAEDRTLARFDAVGRAALSWSPAGTILAAFRRPGGTTRVLSVDPRTGSQEEVLDTRGREAWRLEHSPDGGYFAYDELRPIHGVHRRQIYVAPASGGEAIRLVDHGDNDSLLGWTQDGILFACARTGEIDAWLAPVSAGKLAGEPRLVLKGLGEVTPVGVSASGDFHFVRRTAMMDVYTASLHWDSGGLLQAPERAGMRYGGSHVSPDWSHDGSSLAYVPIRRPPGSWPFAKLMIRSYPGGVERELEVPLEVLEMVRWCPDGRTLIGVGFAARNRLVRIDAGSGAMQTLLESPGAHSFHEPICTASEVLYKRRDGFKEPGALRSLDLASGADREILPSVYRVALSPDRRMIAYSTFDEHREYVRTLHLDGRSRPRDLFGEPRAGRIVSVAFDPSGKSVLFAKGDRLWKVSLSGGEPQPWPLTAEALRDVRVHPGGKLVAFTSGSSAKGELWVWRNALPKSGV
ncbi:MAG: hypothetical protein K2X35_13185 [Bryobacteraceae bacterium]|nr:hypothetical protein [Bryobacteraceae bacterium]